MPSAPTAAASGPSFSPRDLLSGLVVFVVALPLCLGVALASDAPLISGILAGIIGGIVVGWMSGSHTSVSGPAAGLTAVVAAQLASLGSFSSFLVAVFLAGVMQVGLGLARAGFIAAFFPSSVIKGLLAAIGTILVLKQIPHVLGHDPDPVGEMTFRQLDGENTFTELLATMFDIQPGAALVGLLSLAFLLLWERSKALKQSGIPAALLVVLGGAIMNLLWTRSGSGWAIGEGHMVAVPVAQTSAELLGLLTAPNFAALTNPEVYVAGLTIAIVASLETLLNLEAVDRIDPLQRKSPPNRELLAQGVGNILASLVGALPMTSVIVRSSVNINSGNRSRYSAIFHGVLLLGAVAVVPHLLNLIPLASLAAILLATGLKLASPQLVKQMWSEGRRQFLPFIITVLAIVLIDLLTGVVIGLVLSTFFILHSNFKRPLSRAVEAHPFGDVLRIELSNQVSFFSRAALERAFAEVPKGGHMLIDARSTDYIDPDILDLIHDFRTTGAPARDIKLSFLGFKKEYPELADKIHFVEHASVAIQRALSADEVLALLQEGNERFRNGQQLSRDLRRQVSATASGQAPLAVALSCMDSRAPVELVFDMGIGDIFSVRVAGNVAARKILGSLEYGCVVAGAKLLVVLGHTSCGAVTAAVRFKQLGQSAVDATGCEHIDVLVDEIEKSIEAHGGKVPPLEVTDAHAFYVDAVARTNVLRTMAAIREKSTALEARIQSGELGIVGALYDVHTGVVSFFDEYGMPKGKLPRSIHPELGIAP